MCIPATNHYQHVMRTVYMTMLRGYQAHFRRYTEERIEFALTGHGVDTIKGILEHGQFEEDTPKQIAQTIGAAQRIGFGHDKT